MQDNGMSTLVSEVGGCRNAVMVVKETLALYQAFHPRIVLQLQCLSTAVRQTQATLVWEWG